MDDLKQKHDSLELLQVRELQRTPKKLVGWQPESSYVVPSAQPEALPHSAEGTRRDGTN